MTVIFIYSNRPSFFCSDGTFRWGAWKSGYSAFST